MPIMNLSQDRISQMDNASTTEKSILVNLKSKLNDNKLKFNSSKDFRKFLSSEFEIAHPRDLLGLLLFLNGAHTRNIDKSVFIKNLDEALDEWQLPEIFVNNWNLKKDLLFEIAKSNIISFISKKNELYYRHSNHIHDFRILTEVRPVLNYEKEAVEDYIIINKLHIIISDSSENEKYFEVPIRLDELGRLQKEIKIAIEKTSIVEKNLALTKKPTTIYTRET